MPTILVQASVGAGKTETALQYLAHTLHNPEKPFARAWVLLATRRQELAFRQRLVDLQDQQSVYFNAEFFNFYDLNARLLNLAGTPARKLTEVTRGGILRQILEDFHQQSALSFFAPIALTQGFRHTIGNLIYEFKQNLIEPQHFRDAAQTQKDHEIALIYERYQQVLQAHDLVDREGEGWLALEALRNQSDLRLHTDLLLVDGYDQFSPVQAATLAQLSLQIPQVVVTLTRPDGVDHDRARVIGKRFVQASEHLLAAHLAIGAELLGEIPEERPPDRAADLVSLTAAIFSDQPPVAHSGAIQMIEAPDAREEVAALLRQVKRLLLAGEPPDEILIAVRDWQRYHAHFVALMHAYDLPLLLHYQEPLANNPLIDLLVTILQLVTDQPDRITAFRRRDVLDVLRSPYIRIEQCTPELVDWLDVISREFVVIGGKSQWDDAIDAASSTRNWEEESDTSQSMIDTETHAALSVLLEDLFNLFAVPSSAPVETYVMKLDKLIGREVTQDPDDDDLDQEITYASLNIPECIQQQTQSADLVDLVERDMSALQQFRDLLRTMIETEDFLRRVLGKTTRTVSWQGFRDELIAAVGAHYRPIRNPSRSGRVLVTTATDARGLPHRHVLIPGLSEGIFPAEVGEDPMYLDSERKAFQVRGLPLQMLAERADDSGIFYELISLPRRTLTVSRPYVRDGKPWVESHLWRMVRQVFADLPLDRIAIGQTVLPKEVASLDEALLSLADRLSHDRHVRKQPDVLQLAAWIHQQPAATEIFRQIEYSLSVETRRLSRRPHDTYSGKLEHPARIDQLRATHATPEKSWSATSLGQYGTCPFSYFASRVLRLEALEEPQEGADALKLGSLYHAILEKTYHMIAQEKLVIRQENAEIALEMLEENAYSELDAAPRVYQFRESALWRNEKQAIFKRLHALISKDFSSESPLEKLGKNRRVYRLEQGFGGSDPLAITFEGETIFLSGFIDRIDITEDNQLLVVDYKSGSTKIDLEQIESGRNFQMLIYLEALEALYAASGYQIAGGLFWHIRNNQHSGLLNLQTNAEIRKRGLEQISSHVNKIRSGEFMEKPTKIDGGKCSNYCEFYRICRLPIINQYKKDS